MDFAKAETFGYGLNGKEFFVPQGQSYTTVKDGFQGTSAQILGGTNGSTVSDAAGRAFTKDVTTGWSCATGCGLESNILTLWGLADLYASHTDTYALSMSSDQYRGWSHFGRDQGILVTQSHGQWLNAVDANAGGTQHFVYGPWKASYGLGTYGVDPSTHTAGAVINHAGQFAIAR